jgi:hypothetical protein
VDFVCLAMVGVAMRGLMRRTVAGAAVVLRWRVVRLLMVAGLAAGVLACIPSAAQADTWAGVTVTAADANGNPIDIPYYQKDGASYAVTSVDDSSGLYHLVQQEIDKVNFAWPKDVWNLDYGNDIWINTFIGTDNCSSEPWPFHTLSSSYQFDPTCWESSADASQSLIPGDWEIRVPSTVTAGGQTLIFDHWSDSADTSRCATGDQGYVHDWPGAGNATPGVPGAFAAGEQFTLLDSATNSVEAHYAVQATGTGDTTAPLIEIDNVLDESGMPAGIDCQWFALNQVVAPQFSCNDQGGSGVKSCTATSGVTADGNLDTSTPGQHNFTVTATDNQGNTRTLSERYFVDGQPPAMTIATDPAAPSSTGWYNASQLGAGNSLRVNVTISDTATNDSGIDTASCTLDGSPYWSFDSQGVNPNTTPAGNPPQFTAPGPQTFQIGQGTHTLSCTATDLSGQTTTQSATYKVDTNPPPQATFLNPSPPDIYNPYTCAAYNGLGTPATYEAGTQQSIQWWISGDDGTSGGGIVSPATTTGDAILPTSTIGSQAASAPDTVDAAGNVTPGQSCAYNVVDTIPPADTPAVTGTQGSNGWYTSDVTVNWHWTDAGSGVDPSNCTQASTTSGEGAGLMVMASCTDLGGNKAIDMLSFNVDKTPPVVSVTGVQNGAQYIGGGVPAAGCSTTDATSGVAANASVSVTPAGSGVGSYTATCSGAVDKAGNKAAPASVTYTVAYGFGGFSAPSPGSTAKYNPGAALPVKFTLTTSNGTPISASLAATLASKLTVTLAGQGITPVTARCNWNKSTGMFECPVKIPALSKTGSSHPYTITAYESVPGGQVNVPSWTTTTADQNPETIYFK